MAGIKTGIFLITSGITILISSGCYITRTQLTPQNEKWISSFCTLPLLRGWRKERVFGVRGGRLQKIQSLNLGDALGDIYQDTALHFILGLVLNMMHK